MIRTIGLIGGLSWKATISYYDYINIEGNRYLGKSHSPHLIVDSLDFGHAAQLLHDGADELLLDYLLQSANRLIDGGADAIVICCNSAHKVATELGNRVNRKVIDIRHEVAALLAKSRVQCVALLGTRFTMEQEFYRDILNQWGVRCLVPDSADIVYINNVIMTELSVGIVSAQSKLRFIEIAGKLTDRGASAIVLACTELPLLLSQADFDVDIIDTVKVHADSAIRYATAERAE